MGLRQHYAFHETERLALFTAMAGGKALLMHHNYWHMLKWLRKGKHAQ